MAVDNIKCMKKILCKFIVKLYDYIQNIRAYYQKNMMAECGDNVCIEPHGDFVYSHIHIGSNVYVGPHASFMASVAHVYIDDYVMLGPYVTIRGGDHRTDVLGKHIIEVTAAEKLAENDADVRIEKGAWIGCNVTTLKGVTIGTGAVVAAGAVVTKSIPAYAVAAGTPAKVIKYRFTEEEIAEHERILRNRGVL